jgi:hypothetical protein
MVTFSRNMKTGGTGVVGTLVTFGTMLVVTFGPEGVLSRVAAKTTPGSTRRMIHTTAEITVIRKLYTSLP